MQQPDSFLHFCEVCCDEGQFKYSMEKQVIDPCRLSIAVSWQNTFGDLDLYLMHVIIYLQETKDTRESSFFLSAESSKDILQHFIFHFFFVLKIQASKDLPFKIASEV